MGVLKVWDGLQWVESAGATGDVNGPSSSTDNAITRWDGTAGKLVQNSLVRIDDSDNIIGLVNLTMTGDIALTTIGATVDGVDLDDAVLGPSSATDNTVPRYDSTTGKLLQTSGMVISNSNVVSGVTLNDAVVSASNVTQHEAAIDHDALTNFLAIEHQKPRCALHYSDPTPRTADAAAKVGGVQMNTDEGWVMPWAGSILAHGLSVEIQTANVGDVTFQARINDVTQATLEIEIAVLDGTGKKRSYVVVDSGSVTFAAGDFINARANETGDMGWDDLIGTIWVEFDS